ncbi:MAG TPA: hypothetical protein VGR19_10935 [Allosphingosinicella sp.]|nr:hypothetical protein [Allosphingosinicella sp.]
MPAQAEQYLRDLERALWPLGSDERETILLELRGHLAGCAEQGGARVNEALRSLGTPEECSRAFVVEGAGEAYRRAGMPARALVPLGPPPEFSRKAESLSIREVTAQVLATFRASRREYWAIGALLLTVLTATNFLSYLHSLRPGIVEDIWPIMLIRAAVVIAALAAAYRASLTQDQPVWGVNLSTLRFGAGLAALTVLAVGLVLLVVTAAMPLLASLPAAGAAVGKALLVLVLLAFCSAAYLRLQPWLVGLAIDRREVTLKKALVETRGKTLTIVKAWAVLVLPLYLLHFALTAAAMNWAPITALHLALAGLDGIASMGVAIVAALLNAAVFRWVVREPIPAPLPFSQDWPSDNHVEEARARLKRHMEAGRGRFAR